MSNKNVVLSCAIPIQVLDKISIVCFTTRHKLKPVTETTLKNMSKYQA